MYSPTQKMHPTSKYYTLCAKCNIVIKSSPFHLLGTKNGIYMSFLDITDQVHNIYINET